MKKVILQFVHNNKIISHTVEYDETQSDYWDSFEQNGQVFDVNIDDERGEVCVYEYDEQLDEPSHRYILAHRFSY